MTQDKTILVLGGGVGGLVSAVELRKSLPTNHRVVLVDRERDHLFAPSLLWLMTGLRSAEQISRPLHLLHKRGIEVVTGGIERIDPSERQVVINGKTHKGDFLVVSLGADLASDAIPGLAEAGHNFYTLPGAESLRNEIKDFRSGRLIVLTAVPAYKCPAGPYEAAMLLEADCRKRRVRSRVQIDLYAAEPAPMGVTGPTFSAGVRALVESKDISYLPDHQVTEVDPIARRIYFANDAQATFDVLAFVPPHRPPQIVTESGLAGESGWVTVDRYTLETPFAGVYAIGDVTRIPLQMGKPLPMAGTFAHGQASAVARQISSAITGTGKATRFDGRGQCFVETGDGKASLGRGNFYAEPAPQVKAYNVGRHMHVGKVLFENYWLKRWF